MPPVREILARATQEPRSSAGGLELDATVSFHEVLRGGRLAREHRAKHGQRVTNSLTNFRRLHHADGGSKRRTMARAMHLT